MAAEIGVDRLCWELTDHPEDMFSRRFVPGTPDLAAIQREIWDDNNLGNAIPGATPRAQIEVRQSRARVASADLGSAADGRPGARCRSHATIRNLSTRPFPAQASYGRRWCASARSSATATARVINRDFERAWLPADAASPAQSVEVPMTLTAPATPGRYALKFDLVSEGIDWFEACGSQTTTKTLIVI